MAWSTRLLAELADTTVKAVRHYHEIGLLDQPERASNGYKQYDVPHLVRLLEIKRLSELGFSLAQIGAMDRADGEPDEAIRALDADLEATMDRLSRIRAELSLIMRHRSRPEVPSGFASVSRPISETHRALLMVYSTILSEKTLDGFRQLLEEPDKTEGAFDQLPSDADEATVEALAKRMAPSVRRGWEKHPWSADPTADSPRGATFAKTIMAQAVAELYNPAQLRVLQRVNELVAPERDARTS